jgi:hypothetical protein
MTITIVSADAAGNEGNNESTLYSSGLHSISADGRYVAFYSFASNLVAGDTNGTPDIFVKDTQTGAITRVSVEGAGAQANSYSYNPSISADGRYVAFYSEANNLVSGDTNNATDIFVKDTQTGAITRVSVDGGGAQANNYSFNPSISADGRYVAFYSGASNLVAGDTNGTSDIFVKDTLTGAIQRVSTGALGTQANSGSYEPSISADGRYVAFRSDTSNLVAGDTNGTTDIFVKDTLTGGIARVSVDGAGAQANNSSYYGSLSGDGRTVAFLSYASNLVPGDTNNTGDVFLASNPLILPSIFTTAADVVDLNSFDLSLYTLAEDTNALGGNDVVTLSNTQNIGVLFNAGDGDDTVTGSTSVDLISGGGGKDTVSGGAGNDTFIVSSADLVSGDTIDGGADTDTLRVEGGGTIDLTLLSLSNVENITLTNVAGTNVTVTAAQAALISSTAGTTDIVNISGNFNTDTALVKQLLNAGVDQVKWTSSVYGSATVLPDPEDATQFIVTYTDNDLTRPFDFLRTTYDAGGNRVAQTQLFDTGLNNGVLHQQEYDPLTGGLISNVYIDSLGTRTFQSVTTDFVGGVRTHTRTINDNNTTAATDDTIVDQYYDPAGVIILELTTDASPGGLGKPWVSVAREYTGGVTQIFRTTYDNGNQQVLGTAGSQEIEGGSGNDVLLGGASADSFVFAPGFGNDTVHDYLDGTDKFDFTAFNVDTHAELLAIASITAAGTATLIDFGGGDRVTIRNLSPAAINDSDFILV